MKKNLLAILSVLAILSSNAQITLTELTPDVTLNATYATETQLIDFDGDSYPELLIYGSKKDTTVSGFPITITGFAMETYGTTEISAQPEQLGMETILLADSIRQEEMIDASRNYLNSNAPSIVSGIGLGVSTPPSGPVGNFINDQFYYVGVRFDVSNNTHYGWIRVKVNATTDVAVVDAYAYNTLAATGIEAGELGNGAYLGTLENSSFTADDIHFYNELLTISSNQTGTLVIHNLLGEQVFNTTLSNGSFSKNLSGLNSGIYLVTISNNVSKLTKKIVVE